MKLTVIFRDNMPTICLGEPVSHRRVTVDLTPEQADALRPRFVGVSGGQNCHEEVSLCFIEGGTDGE